MERNITKVYIMQNILKHTIQLNTNASLYLTGFAELNVNSRGRFGKNSSTMNDYYYTTTIISITTSKIELCPHDASSSSGR